MQGAATDRSQPIGISRDALLAALSDDPHTAMYASSEFSGRCCRSHRLSPSRAWRRELRELLLEFANPSAALASVPIAVPKHLVAYFLAGVERIRASAMLAPETFFSIDNDFLIKDLTVCLGQMFPAGARLIDLRSGLPRKLLFWQGASLPSALGFLRRQVDSGPGSKPTSTCGTFLSSTKSASLDVPPGSGIARSQPQVRGVFGGSWFYDPVLAKISPHSHTSSRCQGSMAPDCCAPRRRPGRPGEHWRSPGAAGKPTSAGSIDRSVTSWLGPGTLAAMGALPAAATS